MAWVDTILQGLLLGGLYALFATGLSLIFGVMRIVNLAHGDLSILAAFLAVLAVEALGWNPFLVLILVVPLMAAVGYALQMLVLNRLLGRGILPPILVTFGLSIIIQNALLQLVISRMSVGRAFRATSDDQETAELMGIDNRRLYGAAMALALGIVAVAGVFLGIRTTFTFSSGPDRLLFAFEAVIIGGRGSLWGTLVGGALLGIAQTVGAKLSPGWGILAGHLVFLAGLLLRPDGLFAKARRVA